MVEQENRVEVEIYGEEYILKGKESVEYLKKVTQYVDKMMKDVATRNIKLPLNKVAILTALNIADEMIKMREKYEKIEQEYNALIEEITKPEPDKRKKRASK